MKITRRQLRLLIKEAISQPLSESITDMAGTVDMIDDHVEQIVNAFGRTMSSLWDEDRVMMRGQGYTDRSQWDSQVGSAELELEDRLQADIAKAIQEVESQLHSGEFYSYAAEREDSYPKKLGYTHPETGESVMINVETRDDMDDILDPLLRQYPDLPFSVD